MELPAASHRTGALIALAAWLALPAAQAATGRTAGQASVSAEGEATYSIPLVLPPGTNGLSPVLSLEYRHRARGGLLGVGWSLGGLSQVARCARTVAQDGVAEPAGRFGADRFCLDGQRLVAVSGAYGAPNAEYRTEIESFARIRGIGGTSAVGPAYFIVERSDGRTYEYGMTPDSSIDGLSSAPAGAARTWALNRIRDRAGNVIDYRYTEDAGSLAYRIVAIRYFDRGTIERGTSREAFLDSSLGSGAELLVENGSHRTYRILPETGLAAPVYFEGSRLRSVSWQLALPADKESGWSVENELERKALHDDWLRDAIGEPPYRYPWGQVESDYDPKGCASSVIMTYAE